MRKKVLIYSLLFLSLCYACSDNENLKPSGFDKDWFVIENDPNDPLKSLVYDIYVNQKVPVFYNDTIGKSVREVDDNGNPVIHYQILVPHYTIDGMNTTYRFVISRDDDVILNGVRFLKERVLDKMPTDALPKSYFLVDSISIYKYDYNIYDYAWSSEKVYKGMATTVCGKLSEIPDMTEIEMQELAAEVIAMDLGPYVFSNYSKELENFYLQTNNFAGEDYYGVLDYNIWYIEDMYAYGFLREISNYYTTPTRVEDVTDYVKYLYIYTDEEFANIYGGYDLIMAKYTIMKSIIADVRDKISK